MVLKLHDLFWIIYGTYEGLKSKKAIHFFMTEVPII